MPVPVFVDQVTKICAAWLNPVSQSIWGAIGDGDNPPVTSNDVKVNLNLDNVTNDEQLKRTAADWTLYPDGGPAFGAGDKILIENVGGGAKQTIDFSDLPGSSGGEANTASSSGVNGIAITLAKSGINLPFKGLGAGSTKIQMTDDSGNFDILIDVNEVNIVHDNISGSGTNSHAQIDTHIGDTSIHFTEASIDHNNIILPASDAHAALAITNVPAGNISSTNVQLAINELETEKVGDSFTSDLSVGYTMALFDLGTNGTVTPDNEDRNRFKWAVTGAAILNAPVGNGDMSILVTGTGGAIDVSAYDHVIGSYDNTKDCVINIWANDIASHFISFGTPAA